MNTFPTCKYLELRPEDKTNFLELLTAYKKIRINRSAKRRKMRKMFGSDKFGETGRNFDPYCTKLDSACVVAVSSVMSMSHGHEGAHQAFRFIMQNSYRIRECKDREPPEGSASEKDDVDIFMLAHLPGLNDPYWND